MKLESNTHFSKAKFLQEGVHDWQGEAGQTEATMICLAIDALVESNLAEAYEQRTANMLTLLGQMAAEQDGSEAGVETVSKLARTIAERLDLA